MKRLDRSRLDKVVRENFHAGFVARVNGGDRRASLEYMSMSGYYSYNDARRIAHAAGYDLADRMLNNTQRISTLHYEMPADAYAACEASLHKPSDMTPELRVISS